MSGNYADAPKWTLVNDFTIHAEKHLSSGRPFMLTRVPQGLWLEAERYKVVDLISWPDRHKVNDDRLYIDKSYIEIEASTKDTIVTFSMSDGEIARLSHFQLQIRPEAANSIGGDLNSSTFDGIPYSGFSSQAVPDDGLMHNEPGRLYFWKERYDNRYTPKDDPHLYAELYLDQSNFQCLIENLKGRAGALALFVLFDLFEDEVQSALSENWMKKDYGLLAKGDGKSAFCSARIETVSVTRDSAIKAGLSQLPVDEDNKIIDRAITDNINMPSTIIYNDESIARIVRLLKYTLFALVVIAAIILFKH